MITYQINQIKFPLDHDLKDVKKKVSGIIKRDLSENETYEIAKKSIDARKKNNIQITYAVRITLENSLPKGLLKNKDIVEVANKAYEFPESMQIFEQRPVIVGSGPAGLFCGLLLAENGYKPIILEQGQPVEQRMKDVEAFFENGELNTLSNIQFGEGGAGTFSDGKINTGVKDKFLRKGKILKEFVEAGAPEEIMYNNKPHIGTDYLVEVVKNIRNKIIALGGEVRFNHKVTDLLIKEGAITGVKVNDDETINTKHLVLAIGHSARDTFEKIAKTQMEMVQKAFAIGLRIEHPQELISRSQYGETYKHKNLPVADYKLTYKTSKGRNVYSFCMCPGGFVVNSTSEKESIVCNGMSNFKRDEVNANAAILVNVTPEDFGSDHVLAGVEFQRKWESLAYELGGANYAMPIQRFGDFCANKVTAKFGDIKPNAKGKWQFANLNDCLPPYVSEAISEGVKAFDRKIRGFANEDAILTGVETRSSSPVRIVRGETLESNVKGIYPCGEGAGYAGGIMSAAIDGIKVAEAVANAKVD